MEKVKNYIRIANSDWNTHTTTNASPQLQRFNVGLWLDMEEKTKTVLSGASGLVLVEQKFLNTECDLVLLGGSFFAPYSFTPY